MSKKQVNKKQEAKGKDLETVKTPEELEDEMKITITEWVTEIISKAAVIYERDFFIPKISFKLNSKSAGNYHSVGRGIWSLEDESLLKFNIRMAALPANSGKYKQTVIHEVAHHINTCLSDTRVKPHGDEWKIIMTDLGADPERTHNYELPPKLVKVKVKTEKKHLPIGNYRGLDIIKTRTQAETDGDSLYYNPTDPEFTCPEEHVSPRYVRDNVCKQCNQLKVKAKKEKRQAELEEKMRIKIETENKKAA